MCHIAGRQHNMKPEASCGYQERMGVDVMMPLDVCLPSHSDRGAVESAMERTSRWAVRSLEAHSGNRQRLFGIVQGGLVPDLRERSVAFTTALGFSGYAVGGFSVGESKFSSFQIITLRYHAVGIDDELGSSAFVKIFVALGSVVQTDGLDVDGLGYFNLIIKNGLHQLTVVTHDRTLTGGEGMALGPAQSDTNTEHADLGVFIDTARI